MITLFLKGGPLDGLELHNIPVMENSEPSLVAFKSLDAEGNPVVSQGLYTFSVVKNEPHAIHVPSEQDKTVESVPVEAPEKLVVEKATKENKIAGVIKLYRGVKAINAKKAAELRPRMLELLARLEAPEPEALLIDGTD